MATDPPDILEQALAEVGPYIGLEPGSEVNPYSSADVGSQITPYISRQTDNLVQDVQTLCTRLAEQGEETLFISVNISGNQCAYLGSTFGKDYIEKNDLVQGFFSYCNEKYQSRFDQSSTSQVKSPKASPAQDSRQPGQNINHASQQSGQNSNQISQQPGHNINQSTQQPGQSSEQTSQQTGHTNNQAPNQASVDVTKSLTAVSNTPVSVATSTTGYHSLLTKETIQEVVQKSQIERDGKKPASLTSSVSSMPTANDVAGPPVANVKGCSESVTTNVSKASTHLDKSIGTDFPDEEESTVSDRNSVQNNQKEGMEKKYVVYIQKPPDVNSNKSVLVYKRPEELQKDTLKKLGLVKSGEETNNKQKQMETAKSHDLTKDPDESASKSREDYGRNRRRGRPPRSVTSANTVISGLAKVKNTQSVDNKTSQHTQSLDGTTLDNSQGQVTRKATDEPSPVGRQAVDTSTSQHTPEAGTKGPFHMRTRSGGKAKRMPWLNKWKNDDEPDEKRKDKERQGTTSPQQQSTTGRKRKNLQSTEDGKKKIKVEVESDSETNHNVLVTSEKPRASKRLASRSISNPDGESSKELENEKTEKLDTLVVIEKSVDETGDGNSEEIVRQTVTKTGGSVDKAIKCDTGSGGVETEVGSEQNEESCDKCEICGDDYDTSEALLVHMESEHNIKNLHEEESESDEVSKEKETYRCFTCDKVFSTPFRLQIHRKEHSSGQYVCNVCGKCYLQERVLLRHINQMHKNKFPCTECQEMFKSRRQREEHMAIKHNLPSLFKCKHCEEKFADVKALRVHAKSHVTPCICEFCGKSYPRRTDLIMHRRTHTKEKPIKCNDCGRGFARASTLLSHKLTHRNFNAFQCEVCGRTFKTKESMRQHKKIHTNVATVKCEHCELKFRTFDGMKNHVIQGHPNITPPKSWHVYSCDKCPKKFGGKQQYIRHMSVHTGVRPHECDICGKFYPTPGALNTHKKIHKECMPERRFHCNVCNHHFGIFSKMKRHLETAKHIQYCSAVGVDPLGNLREYEAKIAAEGNTRVHVGGVQVPADGSMPIVIKNEISELAEYEGDETVECVLIHLPDDEVALQDGAQIVYSINTEDGTIESVFHESAPQEETVTEQTQ
ncbi:uncharacterized protein LOC132549501 [Ylistrum balloti]|uniref:uncharacterized protein LOC132549501 n=1 Tax=Ylistrum balloti TaxID=509963 RepID=UPI002905BECF|nr:uncharacterized protein LOC132549501 [Ylistrum balloti]